MKKNILLFLFILNLWPTNHSGIIEILSNSQAIAQKSSEEGLYNCEDEFGTYQSSLPCDTEVGIVCCEHCGAQINDEEVCPNISFCLNCNSDHHPDEPCQNPNDNNDNESENTYPESNHNNNGNTSFGEDESKKNNLQCPICEIYLINGKCPSEKYCNDCEIKYHYIHECPYENSNSSPETITCKNKKCRKQFLSKYKQCPHCSACAKCGLIGQICN